MEEERGHQNERLVTRSAIPFLDPLKAQVWDCPNRVPSGAAEEVRALHLLMKGDRHG